MIHCWQDITPKGLLDVELIASKTEYNTRSYKDGRKRVNRYVFNVRYLGAEFRKSKEVPVNVILLLNNIGGTVSQNGIISISREQFDAFLLN